MPRYIDADMLIAYLEMWVGGDPDTLITMNNVKFAISRIKNVPPDDVVPESEVDRLKKALAAKDAEYDQALQDKARECNIFIDKIRLENRANLALLHSSHEQELVKAKREVAWKIFAELDKMDIRIVRLLDAIKYMDLVKKYEYKNN